MYLYSTGSAPRLLFPLVLYRPSRTINGPSLATVASLHQSREPALSTFHINPLKGWLENGYANTWKHFCWFPVSRWIFFERLTDSNWQWLIGDGSTTHIHENCCSLTTCSIELPEGQYRSQLFDSEKKWTIQSLWRNERTGWRVSEIESEQDTRVEVDKEDEES